MALGARSALAFAAAEQIAARIAPVAAATDRCPELDCLRHRFSRERLARTEQRAAEIGVGADRVLIAAGALSEEDYLRALAENLGATFEPLDGVPRQFCPLEDARLIEAAKVGMLPLAENGRITLVVAPRGLAARTIAQAVQSDPALAARFRFTTAARLNRFVLRHADKPLAEKAADALRQRWPLLSAAAPRRHGLTVGLAIMAGTVLMAMGFDAVAPATIVRALAITLALLFLAWLALRIAAAATASEQPSISAPLPERELPVYSIICALYREAASVGELLAAIERLDYPREKLDVIFALEADDPETRAAVEATQQSRAVRLDHGAVRRAAHQAEGAQRRAALRAWQLHRDLRRRRPAGARSIAPRVAGVRRRGRRSCLCAGAAYD